jgi:pterin-4a-carbinolamine dehydratase
MLGPRANETKISEEWRRSANRLVRDLRFRDYDSALRFASFIGKISDYGHHAEICVMHDLGGRLRLTVRNLNHAGLTEQELRLASRLDAAIAEHYEWAYGAEAAPRPADGDLADHSTRARATPAPQPLREAA